jgi:hypothetical protein
MKNSTGFILLLVGVALLIVFIKPQYKKLQDQRTEAHQYEDIIQNIIALTEKRDDLLVKYQAMPKAEIERLQKVLPDNIDTIHLALGYDTIASHYGISIKGIEVTQAQSDDTATFIQIAPAAPYEKATVALSFVASYDSFRRFMADIEQNLRLADIKSITFNSTAETGLYEYKVSVETYWLK